MDLSQQIIRISSRPNAFPANGGGAPRNVNISPRLVNANGQVFSRFNARNARRLTNFPTEDGIYLWIVSVNITNLNDYSASYVKVNPYFEFGSKHFMIKNRRPNMVVVGAGEMEKNGTNVRYNLLSGTYQVVINEGLRAMGISDDQIETYYKAMVPFVFGTPAQYTRDPIVDRLIIQQFSTRNLNAAGVAYQNIPYSATRWLKSLITSQPAWTYGTIGRKVGSRSVWGAVFRLDARPELLVKITLLPMKTNGGTAIEMHQNEIRGLVKAREVGVTKIDVVFEGVITVPDNAVLGQIFRGYTPGYNQSLSVVVMTDFFYPPDQFTEHGDFNQFIQRNPGYVNLACEHIRNFMRLLHGAGVRHGDLHPGNILYRKNVSDGLFIFSFIDFGLSVKDKTFTNAAILKSGNMNSNRIQNMNGQTVVRPLVRNQNIPFIYRTPNSWYYEFFYKKV
jgi:hypothetical protein